MENRVEKIMKDYKKELKKIDKKYEVKQVKKPDTKELENKIQYEKDFIAKLEFEGKEANKEMIERAKQRLDKAINEKTEIDLKYEKEKLNHDNKDLEKKKLKNSKVVLESGREVTMAQKDEIDKANLRDKAIRELTIESKTISNMLLTKKEELENKRKEWNEFKYEFEKDENGKLVPTNKAEVEKIHAEFDKIKEEMIELNKMQKQCDTYLEELKAPTQKDKDFMKAWNESAKEESEQEEKERPVQKGTEKKQQDKVVEEESEKEEKEKPVQKGTGKKQQDKVVEEELGQKEKNYSNSQDRVNSIYINAADKKAYVKTMSQDEKEIDIEEAIKNRKELYKRLDIKSTMENLGVDSKIRQFVLKRKINPVILTAIQDDKEAVEEYIDSLIFDEKFPFEYTHNLENSKLSNKNDRLMNRVALKEEKIEGAEVIGAEKFHGVKKLFRNAKSKVQALKANRELERLEPGEKQERRDLKNDPSIVVNLDELEKQRMIRTNEIYMSLSQEQREELAQISIRSNIADVQNKYHLNYNEAYNLVEKYGKDETEEQLTQTTNTEEHEVEDL